MGVAIFKRDGIDIGTERGQRVGDIRAAALAFDRKNDARAFQCRFLGLEGQRPDIIIDMKAELRAGGVGSDGFAIKFGVDALPGRCRELADRADDAANPCSSRSFRSPAYRWPRLLWLGTCIHPSRSWLPPSSNPNE